MNVDIEGSRRNGPQLSTRHDDDDDVLATLSSLSWLKTTDLTQNF